MKKSLLNFFIVLLTILINTGGHAQKVITKTGTIKFQATVPSYEEVAAENKSVSAILDQSTGDFAALALIKGFRFKVALMEEHFNENYLESEKYPTASFKGKIQEQHDLSKAGTYPVTAEGSLTIHGVTKPVTVKGTILSSGTDLKLDFKFQVEPEEYKIEVPSLVITKIAETIDVTGKMTLVKK